MAIYHVVVSSQDRSYLREVEAGSQAEGEALALNSGGGEAIVAVAMPSEADQLLVPHLVVGIDTEGNRRVSLVYTEPNNESMLRVRARASKHGLSKLSSARSLTPERVGPKAAEPDPTPKPVVAAAPAPTPGAASHAQASCGCAEEIAALRADLARNFLLRHPVRAIASGFVVGVCFMALLGFTVMILLAILGASLTSFVNP